MCKINPDGDIKLTASLDARQHRVHLGGNGLVLPVIVYLAVGVSQDKLGATMGRLAAAGLGQMLDSLVGEWFSVLSPSRSSHGLRFHLRHCWRY